PDDVPLEAAVAACLRAARCVPADPPLEHLVAGRVADVVLVDVELAVETELVRVRAQEALDVGGRRQLLEVLVLERAQVLPADLRAQLELGEVELLAHTRLAE